MTIAWENMKVSGQWSEKKFLNIWTKLPLIDPRKIIDSTLIITKNDMGPPKEHQHLIEAYPCIGLKDFEKVNSLIDGDCSLYESCLFVWGLTSLYHLMSYRDVACL